MIKCIPFNMNGTANELRQIIFVSNHKVSGKKQMKAISDDQQMNSPVTIIASVDAVI